MTTKMIATEALTQLINPAALKWERTIPSAGERSPEYAMLHEDAATRLTTLMFRTLVPVHIKLHSHELAETHVVKCGENSTYQAP
jgi:hypothetical protein